MFWRNSKQKPFESNFQFSAFQKSFHIFISSFLFHFVPPVLLLLSFCPTHTLSNIFLADPTISLFQPRTRATNPISLGHLQPLDASRRLRPPWMSCQFRCVIRLRHHGAALPPPPLPLRKLPHPITSPSPFPSPIIGAIEVPPLLPPSSWPPAFRHLMAL
jgi:hypothetical protein